MRTLCLTVLVAVMLTGVVFADNADRMYAKAAEKYHLLYDDTPYRLFEDNWLKTIKQFQVIHINYPDHPVAPKSLYNIGKLYRSLYQWNKKAIHLDRSNIYFRKLVQEYRSSSLADDAQYLLAENYERYKKNYDIALEEYKRLVELFPESARAEQVKDKIAQARLDQRELFVPSNVQKTASPTDLTVPRYGGISEQESAQREATLLSKVDYWTTMDWSRMVIDLKGDVRYKYEVLLEDELHPYKRFYIDVLKSYIPPDFNRRIAANDGLIRQARIGQYDKDTVRIVLDMESIDKIKVFHFELPHQYKIVIDILGKADVGTLETRETPSPPDEKDRETETGAVSLSKALGLKVKTIIIDPGHGGKDPGASSNGVQEKDLALQLSLLLKEMILKENPRMKVLMTRSDDTYVKLEERTAFANKNRGDLFLSIHINASPREKLSGVETYYLNLTTDNDALDLAAKENQTSMKSISDLQAILNDLMINSKISESRDLAEKVQFSIIGKTVKSHHVMVDLGVKKAPFIVLLGAQMPSILIEAGFLTNSGDRHNLQSSHYQRTIAEGIYDGIMQYIN